MLNRSSWPNAVPIGRVSCPRSTTSAEAWRMRRYGRMWLRSSRVEKRHFASALGVSDWLLASLPPNSRLELADHPPNRSPTALHRGPHPARRASHPDWGCSGRRGQQGSTKEHGEALSALGRMPIDFATVSCPTIAVDNYLLSAALPRACHISIEGLAW